jgi:hypothetical protein
MALYEMAVCHAIVSRCATGLLVEPVLRRASATECKSDALFKIVVCRDSNTLCERVAR